MLKRILLACLVGSAMAGSAKPQEKSESPAAPANPAEAEALFQAKFGEWKQLLAQLRQLAQRFRVSPPADREAIKAQYEQLTAQGDELLPQLRAAAEAAFVGGAKNKAELVDFLLETAQDDTKRGNPAAGLRVAKLLMDHGANDRRALMLAGAAAFYADDYAETEKYFSEAEKAGLLNNEGRVLLSEAKLRAAEAKADDLPRVLLKTAKGDIELELFENQAPNTVANFVSLVERGYYNGLTFHRVLPGFMAQGGCPEGTGGGGPGYRIRDEVKHSDARVHLRGTLSMAKAQLPDTGGSQFFITFQPTPHLDGLHTAFGRVIKGMDVVDKIAPRNPDDPNAAPGEKILEATVVRKREHEYKPETLPE
jgi:cyclophilin family peptidyl-prolyl cis-trans isomerase